MIMTKEQIITNGIVSIILLIILIKIWKRKDND